MAKQPSSKKNKISTTPTTRPAENPTSLDSVCTCQTCDHGLARDCLKVRCICCKDYNHSMVLDGIEGFPPTQNHNKNVGNSNQDRVEEKLVKVAAGKVTLEGILVIPNEECKGIVLFAHGSGSGRHSPRNRYVAQVLQEAGLATLLIDLLTTEEESIDMWTRHLRLDIQLRAERLSNTTNWIIKNSDIKNLSIGYFGASTGAGAALVAASERPGLVKAIVSRGGRPDLAGEDALSLVKAPTLLIVGANDEQVIDINREALKHLTNLQEKELVIVPGATHLFEEPGTLENVSELAANWFVKYLF
jgi:dienelactone hydrolase